MPGSQDRLAGQDRLPDSAQPHEARDGRADLRQRLERLPPGHPSSLYTEDGARRPPEPDPAERELPLPAPGARGADGPGSPQADRRLSGDRNPAGTDSAEEDKPRVGEDGSWEWKGRRLTPDQCRIADQALARCRAAEGRGADGTYDEHGITPAMRCVEDQVEHGKLVDDTEKYALKSPDRFKEKLARQILRTPDKSSKELSHEIHDTIRYTFVLSFDNYTDAFWKMNSILQFNGFQLERRRNMWKSGSEYKGVNSRWVDRASSLPFEIQFHTRDSWEAKQQTHEAYEKIEDYRTPPHERERLRAYQRLVSTDVQSPPRVTEITDYSREGR